MIDDIDAHSDAGVRSVDADESGRADYARRLILARRPEITDADLAALADPPAELLMAEIGEEIADVLAALAEKERRLISQRTKDALAVRKAQGAGRQAWRASTPRASRTARKPRRGPRRCGRCWWSWLAGRRERSRPS
jgi:hypothetical protein